MRDTVCSLWHSAHAFRLHSTHTFDVRTGPTLVSVIQNRARSSSRTHPRSWSTARALLRAFRRSARLAAAPAHRTAQGAEHLRCPASDTLARGWHAMSMRWQRLMAASQLQRRSTAGPHRAPACGWCARSTSNPPAHLAFAVRAPRLHRTNPAWPISCWPRQRPPCR